MSGPSDGSHDLDPENAEAMRHHQRAERYVRMVERWRVSARFVAHQAAQTVRSQGGTEEEAANEAADKVLQLLFMRTALGSEVPSERLAKLESTLERILRENAERIAQLERDLEEEGRTQYRRGYLAGRASERRGEGADPEGALQRRRK